MRVTLTATARGPRLDVHPQNCRAEGDQPGTYLFKATAEATAD
ncbi:hypothetical protein GCM10009609_17260 [Pseudonocardia aurantiaca]|uniref:Uncharacterized protein n=1 Tax=Pseudonocardia aurantiaca TaxID=75290 RepID=A0ABW4FWL1_9PSEU